MYTEERRKARPGTVDQGARTELFPQSFIHLPLPGVRMEPNAMHARSPLQAHLGEGNSSLPIHHRAMDRGEAMAPGILWTP